MSKRILIAPSDIQEMRGPYESILSEAGFELVWQPTGHQLNEAELVHWLQGCDASLAGSELYTARVLQECPMLKTIARIGVGYDGVNLPQATKQGIVVTIAPGTNQGSAAEHVFALLLAFSRNVIFQHHGMLQGQFPRQVVRPVRGQTLGIAGLGRIGQAVATRAIAFEMNVIAYDPFMPTAFAEKWGIESVSFDTLLERSDVLTLHLPANEQTFNLMNRDRFMKMKRNAILINTSRGTVVDESALDWALRNQIIAGAGIDVYAVEPPGVLSYFDLPNVVLTPHNAGVDELSLQAMAASAAQAVVDLDRGNWPEEKIVNSAVRQIRTSL
jgi:D-3-phosphoglycerate dehydrogenase / 2-oxoglutarate reductase